MTCHDLFLVCWNTCRKFQFWTVSHISFEVWNPSHLLSTGSHGILQRGMQTAKCPVMQRSDYAGNYKVVGNGNKLLISLTGPSVLPTNSGLLKLEKVFCVPNIAKSLLCVKNYMIITCVSLRTSIPLRSSKVLDQLLWDCECNLPKLNKPLTRFILYLYTLLWAGAL